MKIFLNRKPVKGPWGGGNKTLQHLVDMLSEVCIVTYELEDDVDVIYCQDPKPDASGIWYQHFIEHRNRFSSKIIQRVGDIGTHRGPEVTNLVRQTTQLSDFVIFPSLWAKRSIGYQKQDYCIVQNAPLDKFYEYRNSCGIQDDKLRVVTHHWSMNDLKGFDMYEKLGKLASQDTDIEFCYIGRYSDKFNSDGIDIISPKDVDQLAEILPKHDVYLTASRLEAGANHVLEGMACGLPVVYHSGGGSIEEYCCSYGLEYTTFEELVSCLDSLKSNYDVYKSQVLRYRNKIGNVMEAYKEIIFSVAGSGKKDEQ